jgi:hypothetical protein
MLYRPKPKPVCDGRIALNVSKYRPVLIKGTGHGRPVTPPVGDGGGCLIGYLVTPKGLELTYRVLSGGTISYMGKEVTEFVRVTWSACHFGGRRPWFMCPGCNKRVGKLYHIAAGFRCRGCGGFVYFSQRELGKQRGWAMSRKIRIRLGGDDDVSKPLPAKPAGMKPIRYRKLLERVAAAEGRARLLGMRLRKEKPVRQRGTPWWRL